MNADIAALEHIARLDPDGGSVPPTEADYAAHKAWAIAQYGEDMWNRYFKSNWGV